MVTIPVTDPVAPIVWHLCGSTKHRRHQRTTLGNFHRARVPPLTQKRDTVSPVSMVKHASSSPNPFRNVFWKTQSISSTTSAFQGMKNSLFFLAHSIASGCFLESVKRSVCVPSQPLRTPGQCNCWSIRVSILHVSGQVFKTTCSWWHAHSSLTGSRMSRGIKHEQLQPATALPSYSMDAKKCRTWDLANGCIPGICMKKLNSASLHEILA